MTRASAPILDPYHVLVGHRAIKIIMRQKALDATAAAEHIRARAESMGLPIFEVAEAIVTVERD